MKSPVPKKVLQYLNAACTLLKNIYNLITVVIIFNNIISGPLIMGKSIPGEYEQGSLLFDVLHKAIVYSPVAK